MEQSVTKQINCWGAYDFFNTACRCGASNLFQYWIQYSPAKDWNQLYGALCGVTRTSRDLMLIIKVFTIQLSSLLSFTAKWFRYSLRVKKKKCYFQLRKYGKEYWTGEAQREPAIYLSLTREHFATVWREHGYVLILTGRSATQNTDGCVEKERTSFRHKRKRGKGSSCTNGSNIFTKRAMHKRSRSENLFLLRVLRRKHTR